MGEKSPSVGSFAAAILQRIEEMPARRITLLVGATYVLGFLVCNIFYGRFRVVSLGLFEGRYIPAGLWMVLFSAGPVLGGVFLAEFLFRGMDMFNPRFPRQRRLHALGAAFAVIAVWWMVFVEFGLVWIGVPGAKEARLPILMYFVLCMVITSIIARGHWLFEGRDGGMPVLTLLFGLVMPLLVTSVFAFTIYPEIDPAYGGAGGWIAELTLNEAVADDLPLASGMEALILDVSDGWVTLVLCGPTSDDSPQAISLSSGSVQSLSVSGKGSVRSAADEEGCS